MVIDVVLTGIGEQTAWANVTKTIWNLEYDVCISSGLAGSLKPDLPHGAVVASRININSQEHPRGALHHGRTVPSDPSLLNLARECGVQIVEAFVMADHVVVRAKEKQQFSEIADVVEMESYAILRQAASFGVRTIAIRAISDELENDLPVDFNKTIGATGHVSIPRVLGQIARHPAALPGLIRFGRNSRRAADSLARVLESYVKALALQPQTSASLEVSAT